MNAVRRDVEPVALVNLAVKVALIACFAIALFAPPDAIAGKALPTRAPLFLAPAILVPVIGRWKRWNPYPHLGDALLSTPFLLDTLGNLLGFYDRYPVTDDVLHFTNWVALVAAFHAFRYGHVRDHRDSLLLGAGYGAAMIVVWEAFEWLMSDAGPLAGDVPDTLSLTYGDTVGDLVISSTGGVVGSVLGRFLIAGYVWNRAAKGPVG